MPKLFLLTRGLKPVVHTTGCRTGNVPAVVAAIMVCTGLPLAVALALAPTLHWLLSRDVLTVLFCLRYSAFTTHYLTLPIL